MDVLRQFKDKREITELSLLLDELSMSEFRQIRKLESDIPAPASLLLASLICNFNLYL